MVGFRKTFLAIRSKNVVCHDSGFNIRTVNRLRSEYCLGSARLNHTRGESGLGDFTAARLFPHALTSIPVP